jgi:2-aminoethylphosphonate-pyruvate transaminase
MGSSPRIIDWKDKLLLTPGPLTTSRTVKQAMLRDLGSRDTEFIGIVRDIRHRLLALAGVDEKTHAAIPMQGSGTFGLEAVVTSTIPRGGKLLVAVNGAYGRRLAQMARTAGIETVTLDYPEDTPVNPGDIVKRLREDRAVTHVSACHCETTSGIMNPIREIGAAVAEAGRVFFVDAMSSFGAVPVDLAACGVDYLVSSANKCVEGVPGFSFVLARLERLLETEGSARNLSLDLLAQYRGLEANGQFRFTPPTHVLLAFHQALLELEEEGGVQGRAARYLANHGLLTAGMRAMGFREYLKPEHQGYIITSFNCPKDPNFSFEEFYRRLNENNYVIYPGKVGNADCFRIGNIGRIFPPDIRDLLAAVRRVLEEMKIALPLRG